MTVSNPFPATIEHRRIDPPGAVHVVGDVHGCLSELRRLVDRLDPTPEDRLVLVGDLVGKGPNGTGVVEFVRAREDALTVRGNTEAAVLADPPPNLTAYTDYLDSLPHAISFDDALVTHAGVDPRKPLAEQTPTDLLEVRSIPPGNGYDGPFWFEGYEEPPRVFFGHTVFPEPHVGRWAVGLDTGCVYGGTLSAYDGRRERVVSVPAERTYQVRAGGDDGSTGAKDEQ